MHLTTKMVVINKLIENTLYNIACLSHNMNLNVLYIVSITIDEKHECEILEIKEPSKIVYIEIGIKLFLEKILDNSDHDFWKYNKNTLYILRDGSYSYLQDLFAVIDGKEVNIVRGSSQKSHMVSPIDFRLSSYMMILCNMDYKKFCQQNAFNCINKFRFLPGLK
uniref:Uncharacterized protein n=1 Tax=Tolypocladium guangdongense TaxID=2730933 RepID=A0A7S9A350_9HYPO|nr:hypothetical protein J6816_mgp02 [Tolypocladium guangdongense]QPF24434.1 hypothetical protein [Tolypocladium guangdongense]